jgi:hypothetical protein
MTTIITLNTTLVRAGPLIEAPLGDELLMMDVDRGAYFGLNEAARQVWDWLKEPASVAALCAKLQTLYEVEPEQCAVAVLAFVNDLHTQGMIQVVD